MAEIGQISLFASFIAGILTFVSPCILPLIPAFISLITGISVENLQSSKKPVKTIFFKTLVFILGFSVIFILLGMSVSWLGGLAGAYKNILRYIGGAVVILFGLHLAGVFKIKFLYRQASVSNDKISAASWGGVFLTGAAFALGWTPCVGPVLASILLVASTQGSVLSGFWLLLFYSLGLGIPFMLTALFINWFLNLFNSIKKYYGIIEKISGILLIFVGILLITDGFSKITVFILQRIS